MKSKKYSKVSFSKNRRRRLRGSKKKNIQRSIKRITKRGSRSNKKNKKHRFNRKSKKYKSLVGGMREGARRQGGQHGRLNVFRDPEGGAEQARIAQRLAGQRAKEAEEAAKAGTAVPSHHSVSTAAAAAAAAEPQPRAPTPHHAPPAHEEGTDLQQKITDLQQEITDLQQQNATHAESLRARVEELEEELQETQDNLDSAAEIGQQMVERLQVVEENVAEKDKSIADLEQELEEQTQELEEQGAEVEETKQQMSEVQQKTIERERQLAVREEKVKAAEEAAVAPSISQSCSNCLSSARELARVKAETDREKKALREDAAVTNGHFRREIETLQARAEQEQKLRLTEKVTAKKKVDTANTGRETAETNLQAGQRVIAGLEKQLATKNTEKTKLHENLEAALVRLQGAERGGLEEAAQEALQHQVDDLQARLQQGSTNKEEAQAHATALATAEQRYTESERKTQSLSEDLAAVRAELEAVKGDGATKDEAAQEHATALAAVRAELETVKGEGVTKDEAAQAHATALARAHEEAEANSRMVEELKQRHAELSEKLRTTGEWGMQGWQHYRWCQGVVGECNELLREKGVVKPEAIE